MERGLLQESLSHISHAVLEMPKPALTKGAKEVYKERNQSEMRIIISWDVVAHTRRQQRPEHIRKGEQQESATTECINCPDGWPSEQKVDQSEPERGHESLLLRCAALLEDGRRVKRNDIDCMGQCQNLQVEEDTYFRTFAGQS